jgi:Ala-tRNA(Pro) deacylase
MCIREYLQSQRVPFAILLHRPAPSSTRLARSVAMPGHWVAKAVLLRADDCYVLAVLPSTHRIVLECLPEVLRAHDVRLATEDEIERIFVDCERGARPPFGRLYGVRTLVDASLAEQDDIVFEGNNRHEGLWMRYSDYEAMEGPDRASFATAIAPRRLRLSHHRAG